VSRRDNIFDTPELVAGRNLVALLSKADSARVRSDLTPPESEGRSVVEVTLDRFGVVSVRYLRPEYPAAPAKV